MQETTGGVKWLTKNLWTTIWNVLCVAFLWKGRREWSEHPPPLPPPPFPHCKNKKPVAFGTLIWLGAKVVDYGKGRLILIKDRTPAFDVHQNVSKVWRHREMWLVSNILLICAKSFITKGDIMISTKYVFDFDIKVAIQTPPPLPSLLMWIKRVVRPTFLAVFPTPRSKKIKINAGGSDPTLHTEDISSQTYWPRVLHRQ